jgi:hypothetical protein
MKQRIAYLEANNKQSEPILLKLWHLGIQSNIRTEGSCKHKIDLSSVPMLVMSQAHYARLLVLI